MRAEVRLVLKSLLARTKRGGEITLDDLGDAIGTMAITPEEIDALMTALEARGRTIGSEPGGFGEETLKRILDAARVIRDRAGRAPSAADLAKSTGLPIARVRNALALARVIAK
jgi:hypothetical protein